MTQIPITHPWNSLSEMVRPGALDAEPVSIRESKNKYTEFA